MPITLSPSLSAAYDDGSYVITRTLSFNSNTGAVLHLVHGHEKFIRAGITYNPTSIEFRFPTREMKTNSNLSIRVGIGPEEFIKYSYHLDNAALRDGAITLTYREFVNTETTPAFEDVTLRLMGATYKPPVLTLEAAGFRNATNEAFPNIYYTPENFQGLRYYGR
jgi:hypothetical protein